MAILHAEATPAKRFFIDLITRDITLEDSVLDLVDNSIDSLIRIEGLDLTANALLPDVTSPARRLPLVEITVTASEITVCDNSGGIPLDRALHDVFHFGRDRSGVRGTLGVYGIGLKRAMFKLGTDVHIKSRTVIDGFEVKLNVNQWRDTADWTIPLTTIPKAKSQDMAGTAVRIRKLRPEIISRVGDGTLDSHLSAMLATTYALFLERYVRVKLNGRTILPEAIPFGHSDEVNQTKDVFDEGGVSVTIYAGLAARVNGKWNIERAGWYVVCNARVVVAADRTELTGWGTATAQFVSKYRGFVGMAFFFSRDPELLPWTTTKRGLNVESPIYQVAKRHMQIAARPVLTFLNKMYLSDEVEQPLEREIADDVKPVDVRTLAATPAAPFRVEPRISRVKRTTTVQVQYPAEVADIERAKKCLRKPSWGASRIGKHALEYFLAREC